MIFQETQSTNNGRKGLILNSDRLPSASVETPTFFIYSQAGSIPHLVYEVLSKLDIENKVIQMPYPKIIEFGDVIPKSKKSLAEFSGLGENFACVQPIDIVDNCSFNTRQLANSVWTYHGYANITPESYLNAVENLNTDLYCTYADTNTNKDCSDTRIKKSVSNTKSYFNRSIDYIQQHPALKKSMMIATLVGGFSISERRECLTCFLAPERMQQIGGFSFEGFHNTLSNMERDDVKEITAIIKDNISVLPNNKFRCAFGCWNPVATIDLIMSGIDVLDGTYPFLVSHRNGVLLFDYTMVTDNLNGLFEINMYNQEFEQDMSPISATCKCLCCSVSKSYVHHLLRTHEMLGSTYIMLHNLNHYLGFFAKIRECISNNTIGELRNWVSTQYRDYLESERYEKERNLREISSSMKDDEIRKIFEKQESLKCSSSIS